MILFYNDRPCNKLSSGNKLKGFISEYYNKEYRCVTVDIIIDNPKSIMTPCYHIPIKHFSNLHYVYIKSIEYVNADGCIVSGFVSPFSLIYGNRTICETCCWYNSNFKYR
jgi:hypothetical protein